MSTKPVNFVCRLPWPPSVNHYYRAVKIGSHARNILSKEARAFGENVTHILAGTIPFEPLAGRLAVEIILHAPTRRKYDVDNRVKPVLDSLQHAGVVVDDEQFDELNAKRGDVSPRDGHAIITIKEIKRQEQ